MNKLIVIDNTEIKQDSQGRYCLNDLHKASGGNPIHSPAQFFRNKSVSDFVQALTDMQICTSPVNAIRGGSEQGTYVCEELVYKYASWINPEFDVKVHAIFKKLVKGELQPVQPQLPNYAEALRQLADKVEQNAMLQLENQQKTEHITSLESYFRNGISPFEFVKGLNGVNSLKVGEYLIGKSWLYEAANAKRVAAYARDRYLTEETTEIALHGKEPFVAYKPVLLRKGAAKLYEWYTKGELPMKKNWNGEYTQDKAVGL